MVNISILYSYRKIKVDFKKGKKKELNPVMYIEPNSALTKLITENLELTLWNQFEPKEVYFEVESDSSWHSISIDLRLDYISEANEKLERNNNQILYYSKQYSGKFWKAEDVGESYRFYDEREWRYVLITVIKNSYNVIDIYLPLCT